MTQPTDTAAPTPTDATPPPPAEGAVALTLRRTLRTDSAETFDILGGEGERVGTVGVTYGGGGVEGILALPEDTQPDVVRGLLGWVTDMLNLDTSAGPGGLIHWVVSTGNLEDFWRRSPGRRTSGAEADVNATRARVEPVLAQMFESVQELPDGGYAVDAGSVRVFVQVRLVDTTVMVRVFSITNVDVGMDDGVAPFLLALNFTLALGRFSIDGGNRAVWCDHVLTADEIDDATLARAIAAVASTADRFDDEIKERFGGRTFREEGSPVEQAAVATGGPGMAGGYL